MTDLSLTADEASVLAKVLDWVQRQSSVEIIEIIKHCNIPPGLGIPENGVPQFGRFLQSIEDRLGD